MTVFDEYAIDIQTTGQGAGVPWWFLPLAVVLLCAGEAWCVATIVQSLAELLR